MGRGKRVENRRLPLSYLNTFIRRRNLQILTQYRVTRALNDQTTAHSGYLFPSQAEASFLAPGPQCLPSSQSFFTYPLRRRNQRPSRLADTASPFGCGSAALLSFQSSRSVIA